MVKVGSVGRRLHVCLKIYKQTKICRDKSIILANLLLKPLHTAYHGNNDLGKQMISLIIEMCVWHQGPIFTLRF